MARSKTFVGAIWAMCQRFGTMVVSFISNLVLARLLTPNDFGTVGMLLFFISIANVFIDSGFGAALIQKKNTTSKDYSTIFILNISISILLYILLFLAAPYVARFYDTEILAILLRVEGLVLIGNALCLIQTNILKKHMDFKRLALANLLGNTLGSVFAIISAFLGLGVWSLVIRVLCVAYITSVGLWKIADWKPSWEFDFSIAKGLFGFGGFMLLSTGLNTIASNLQTLIIGKIFQQRTLGYYTQAITLRNVAADSLQSIIGQVLFPDFASLNSDSEIENKLNKGFYVISFFTTSLLVLLLIIGKPLIEALYTEKWIGAVPYFQILCVGGIFYAIQDVNYYVIAAKGRSKFLSNINLIKIPIYVVVLYFCGVFFGIIGLLWCIVAYAFISYIIFAYVATRLLNTTVKPQIISLMKSIICAAASASILLLFTQYFPINSNWMNIMISSIIYLAILIVISITFKVYPFIYIIKMIKK